VIFVKKRERKIWFSGFNTQLRPLKLAEFARGF